MRRHAQATFARSEPRKPNGRGSGLPLGRFHLLALAAVVAAFFLVPVAQAAAEGLTVSVAGSGNGVVKTFNLVDPTEPPINCNKPSAEGDVCVEEVAPGNGEAYYLAATPAAGSKFVGWTVAVGTPWSPGEELCLGDELEKETVALFNGPEDGYEGMEGLCAVAPEGGVAEVTAEFEEESKVTNLRTLTVTKSPAPDAGTGTGSVSSKPKGVKCGFSCSEAVASMYKETPVLLKAKPSKEATFVEWKHESEKGPGICDGVTLLECTVPMAEDESVEAIFAGSSKPIANPKALTVDKGESSGKGTVKGTGGLGCEAECDETTVLYAGPNEEKAKPGKTVKLKRAAAFGSEFVEWVGCDSFEEEGAVCLVTMETDKTVSAVFAALPNKVLTVNKTYSTGNGSVASKPKGVKCGFYCTQAVANMPEGAAIELKAKPGKETTLVEWVGGDCNGSTELICVVTMNTDETTEAVFSNPSKALKEESAATLTVSKGESTGFGTVKGTGGLGCEFLCTSTKVVYQGPTTKPGKTVKLKSISAPGSAAVEWSGCTGFEEEGAICLVTMEEDTEVVATFEELE